MEAVGVLVGEGGLEVEGLLDIDGEAELAAI